MLQKQTDLLQLMLDAHKENPVWEDDLDPDSKLEYNVFKGKGK